MLRTLVAIWLLLVTASVILICPFKENDCKQLVQDLETPEGRKDKLISTQDEKEQTKAVTVW